MPLMQRAILVVALTISLGANTAGAMMPRSIQAPLNPIQLANGPNWWQQWRAQQEAKKRQEQENIEAARKRRADAERRRIENEELTRKLKAQQEHERHMRWLKEQERLQRERNARR